MKLDISPICNDDLFVIGYSLRFDKFIMINENEVCEIELLHAIPVEKFETMTDEELIDLIDGADYTGEIDSGELYCYWKRV